METADMDECKHDKAKKIPIGEGIFSLFREINPHEV